MRRLRSTLPLTLALALAAGLSAAGPAAAQQAKNDEWRQTLLRELGALAAAGNIPGLAAALIIDGEVTWSGAIGLADIATRRAMTTVTRLNIGSVSKLVTATAVMQLYEQGSLDLDADVNDYLPFAVHHPASPQTPITARQLLTHTAGLNDSDSYGASYACGDPAVSLEDWLRQYLTPGGDYFSDSSFLDSGPGKTFEYSNVGYGLLGLLVERISGEPFSEFTHKRIFDPLGMARSSWFLADLDLAEHATPYWLIEPDSEPDPEEEALLPRGDFAEGDLVPFCLYSFYNYPDGLLRTTIEDLARFVAASLPGDAGSERLLLAATREEVFSDQLDNGVRTDGRVQGLGWRRTQSASLGNLWGHGGADPGVRAHVLHRPADDVTVVVMANRLVVQELTPVLERLFEEGTRLSANSDETPAE